jgi:hypothetical protein
LAPAVKNPNALTEPAVTVIDAAALMYWSVTSDGLSTLTVNPVAGTSQFNVADGETDAVIVGVNVAKVNCNWSLTNWASLIVLVTPFT